MPKSEVEQWKDDIAAEDYICGPNPSLCGPDYDPNWETQRLTIGPDLSVDSSGIHLTTTHVDTIRGSHTERTNITETMGLPFSGSSTTTTVSADSTYQVNVLSTPVGYTRKTETAVPVPETDTDDEKKDTGD
ncbi:MAG: hypothetical protein F4Y39_01870 [Gemmatimonadetes bacterium]|nr:hypothetical protein [Gemmatimonadota bacterium]MYF73337.1 hypothetical protein [Gemmatimonadota bacterium]